MRLVRRLTVFLLLAIGIVFATNAILNVRFATTSITMGAAEILAYGSAVRLEDA